VAFTESSLRSLVIQYDDGRRQLLENRDARLRDFLAHGWRPADLQRVTGYSRETIRQALHPEVRKAANESRRKPTQATVDRPLGSQVSYGDHKPYVVASRLGDLRGPTEGTVTLPHHIDWSGRAIYDLGRPARLASMYKAVLNDASTVRDLREWLNKRALIELWPTLWLPPRLRELWESRFPVLAARRLAVA
jgi:hypothetical protein